jgi:hypothetical protein
MEGNSIVFPNLINFQLQLGLHTDWNRYPK